MQYELVGLSVQEVLQPITLTFIIYPFSFGISKKIRTFSSTSGGLRAIRYTMETNDTYILT